jgi:hypothetical protein
MAIDCIFKTARVARRIFCALIVWLAAGIIFSQPFVLMAQTATGTISGSVHDASSAVIPGAKLTLVNGSTGEARTTVSNAQGFYSFPLLPPGTYKLTVEAAGFKEFLQERIVLDVGLGLTLDPALVIGQASETVTVTNEQPILETQTSSLGEVISNRSIVDLPTNGRNSYGFAALVPGVNASAGFTQTAFDMYNDQFVSINGSRPNQNTFLLDGGLNTEPAFDGAGFFPSVDLVDQYKVQTNNFSAEFSNSAGGVINVITKAGSNQLHGSAYEFYRSTGLTANNFFANQAGQGRAPFIFQQFGATLGGPIKKDKTFFFFAYEGLRWNQALTTVGTVPTAAQRAGDFSQTFNTNGQLIPIYNPFSTTADPANPSGFIRTQFPGNKIPASAINPVAAAILNYVPLPNQPGVPVTGANNFESNTSAPIDKNDFSIRIDQALPREQRLFGRYSISTTNQDRPDVYGPSPNFKISAPTLGNDVLRQQQATIDYTYPVRPDSVLELSSSYIRYHLDRQMPNINISPTVVGLPSYFNDLAQVGPSCFPSVAVTGQGVTFSVPNNGGGFVTEGGCSQLRDAYQVYHEYGNLTHVRGTHTFKMGGDFGTTELATARYLPAGPAFSFGTNFTQGPDPIADTASGVGAASFLLGTGTGSTGSGGPDQILLFRYYGGYFQDDWRILPRLTLNLGIRYDYNTPWTERFNRINYWNPSAPSPVQVAGLSPLVGGLAFPGVNGASRYQFNPDRTNFGPRFGFAYSASQSTDIRGGFGLFTSPITGGGFNGNAVPISGFEASTPWVSTLNNATVVTTLSNPFPNGFVFPTGSSLGLATQLGQSIVAMSRNRSTSYAEQWNLDIQQSFPGHLLMDLAYAGSHGVHLYGDFVANQLPDQYLALGSQLNQLVTNPFYGNPLITAGSLSGTQVPRSQLLLPYPQFIGVTLGDSSNFGASDYNALELEVQRRFSQGFSITGSYTWSKLMDNVPPTTTGFPGGNYAAGGLQDYYNLRAEWAPAVFDVPQYLAVNGMWNLPFGRQRKFLNHGGITNIVVGGWQLNGIGTAATGSPMQITTATNTLFNNGGTQRANWNGVNPKMPGSTANKINEYFNVGDFSAPAAFNYGNTARTLGFLRAPGVENVDLSGIKTTPIRDNLELQLRVEAFNLFNRVQFGPPNTALESGTTGVISNQSNLPRQIQLAAKFIW